MEKQKILVVDDDKEILFSLSKLLEFEGFETIKAGNGLEALHQLQQESPDLIILDVMMPEMDGIAALMKIRETSHIPIIILSAKTEDSDKVYGLTVGADDYISKPYNPAELGARVKALLRRYRAWNDRTERNENCIVNDGLELDLDSKQVIVDGVEKSLTATEFKILRLLMSNPGRVFSAEEIYSFHMPMFVFISGAFARFEPRSIVRRLLFMVMGIILCAAVLKLSSNEKTLFSAIGKRSIQIYLFHGFVVAILQRKGNMWESLGENKLFAISVMITASLVIMLSVNLGVLKKSFFVHNKVKAKISQRVKRGQSYECK